MIDYVDILSKIQNQYLQKESEIIEQNTQMEEPVPAVRDKKKARKNSIKKEDKQEILKMYRKGVSRKDIKELFSEFNPRSISKILNMEDSKKQSEEDETFRPLIIKIGECKKKGFSDEQVMLFLDISRSTLNKAYDKSSVLFENDPLGCKDDKCWRNFGFTYEEGESVYTLLMENRSIAEIAEKLNLSTYKVSKCRKELASRGLLEKKKSEQVESDFFSKVKLTQDEIVTMIQYVEEGKSNEEIALYLNRKKGQIEKCRRMLCLYGINLRKGHPTVYPEWYSKPSGEGLEVKREETPVVKCSLSMKEKSEIIKMKQAGISNDEIQKTLSVSDEDMLFVLTECERVGLKFK